VTEILTEAESCTVRVIVLVQLICRRNKSRLVLCDPLYNGVINALIIYCIIAVLTHDKGSCCEKLAAKVNERSDRGVERINEITSMGMGSWQWCEKWANVGTNPVKYR